MTQAVASMPPSPDALAPPHALCAQCGYSLRGLAKDAACPECALPVAESVRSLPGSAVLRGHGATLRRSLFWADRWLSAWLILMMFQTFALGGLSLVGLPRGPIDASVRMLTVACVVGHAWAVLQMLATRPPDLATDGRSARALQVSSWLWPIAAGVSAVVGVMADLGWLVLPAPLPDYARDLSRACFLFQAWALSSFLVPTAVALALSAESPRLRSLAGTSLALLVALLVIKVFEHLPWPLARAMAKLAEVIRTVGSVWVVFAFAVILSKFRKELDALLAGRLTTPPASRSTPAPSPEGSTLRP